MAYTHELTHAPSLHACHLIHAIVPARSQRQSTQYREKDVVVDAVVHARHSFTRTSIHATHAPARPRHTSHAHALSYSYTSFVHACHLHTRSRTLHHPPSTLAILHACHLHTPSSPVPSSPLHRTRAPSSLATLRARAVPVPAIRKLPSHMPSAYTTPTNCSLGTPFAFLGFSETKQNLV